MKIVVIGGTGLIGSKLVETLRNRRYQAVAAAPATGVNTITGEGLAEALTAAAVVVDVSNSPSFEEKEAMAFFETAGRNLRAAEIAAGVRHHVGLSVVGTELMQDSGYFRAKLAQEWLIKSSPIPYSLVHATQFFEFIRTIANISTEDGTARLPPVRFQPMAAEDVTRAVAEVAVSRPLRSTLEIAGPETFTLDSAVRRVLDHDRDPRPVIADPAARYYGVHVGEETLVPSEEARLGTVTLDWWLENVPPPAKAAPVSVVAAP